MTEPQKKQELITAEAQEIQSLNFDNLDITELERRLEMVAMTTLEDRCGVHVCWDYSHQ